MRWKTPRSNRFEHVVMKDKVFRVCSVVGYLPLVVVSHDVEIFLGLNNELWRVVFHSLCLILWIPSSPKDPERFRDWAFATLAPLKTSIAMTAIHKVVVLLSNIEHLSFF